MIETSDDAVFTCDRAGTVSTWSAAAERLFGCPAGDVVEGPLDVRFPEHLRAEVRSVLRRTFAGERVKHFETEVVRADGMPVPVWLSLCPVLDAGGTAVTAVVVARDVTEQHLTQATLAEVEYRLEEGEALAHLGRWLWDLRTGAVQWSAEFHRIHGVDPLDFEGTFDAHLRRIHDDDRERVAAAMKRSVASGRPLKDEYRIVRPDGGIRAVHVRAEPTIGSAGSAVGLRGIGQDVTDRAGSPA